MILLITAKRITGLQYHRQLVPFRRLGLDYEIQESTSELTDEYLKKFSIISFLREIDDIDKYKKLGLLVHMDIDDYWVLPSSHPLCKIYKQNNYSQITEETLKKCDFITTTTDYLAGRIGKFNENVYVLPNAIDPTEDQWQPNESKSMHNRVRFGYIAGSHHVRDVEMINKELVRLWRDHEVDGGWQLLTAGFNFNKYPDGRIVANPYYRYVEQCFTNNYRFLENDYRQILASNQLIESKNVNQPYQRLNGKTVSNYGLLYDEIDVSIVPLVSTEFNRCKSQLKIIEAGFKKKACMTSNVMPYTEDFNGNNLMLIDDIGWYYGIKYLVKNPEKIEDMKEALHEYVKTRYHIDIVNRKRKQIFELWESK